MNVFVSCRLLIISTFLLLGVGGKPCNNTYSKLSGRTVDQLYAQLLQTDPANITLACAVRCNVHGMCTLFQFKDGQCQLYKEEPRPGIGINSLTGMTEVWRLDLGKAIITFR